MLHVVCLMVGLVLSSTEGLPYPVSQPVYANTQYITAQQQQYRQPQPQQQLQQVAAYQQQPQYISAAAVQTARPVFEPDRGQGLQRYSTQIKQPIQQVLLATNVDRQVQNKASQVSSQYLQQVQAAQQQAQAQEAIAAAQRKASSQTFSRQIQPVPVAHQPQQLQQQQQYQQPQPQYLQQQVKYSRPAAQGYRQAPAPQQQEEEQNPEDYDPNPSYQFGFDVNDDLYTNYQNRKEQRDGNKITGSYSVVDSDGFIRTVTYTADPKEGFKAEVTRQPTDIVVKIPKPDPQFLNKQPQQYIQAVPAHTKAPIQPQKQYQYQYE